MSQKKKKKIIGSVGLDGEITNSNLSYKPQNIVGSVDIDGNINDIAPIKPMTAEDTTKKLLGAEDIAPSKTTTSSKAKEKLDAEIKKQKVIQNDINRNFADKGVSVSTDSFNTKRDVLPIQNQKEIVKNKKFQVDSDPLQKDVDTEKKFQEIKKQKETKKDKKQLEEQSNKVGYAKYEYDQAKINEDDIGLWDKTVGTILNGASSILDYSGGLVKNENGDLMYLPNQSELKQQKVQDSYSNDFTKFLGTAGYEVGRIGGSTIMNSVIPYSGSVTYFGKMFEDSYNNAVREGYSGDKALIYGSVSTAMEYVTGKFLGSATKGLTGGSVNGYEKLLSNIFSKATGNKLLTKILANAGSEATEEFLQEYLENINKLLILDGSKNINDYIDVFKSKEVLQSALYSGLVGAATGGVFGAISPDIDTDNQNVDNNLYDTYKEQLLEERKKATDKNTIKNIDSELKRIEKFTSNNIIEQQELSDNTQNIEDNSIENQKSLDKLAPIQEDIAPVKNETTVKENLTDETKLQDNNTQYSISEEIKKDNRKAKFQDYSNSSSYFGLDYDVMKEINSIISNEAYKQSNGKKSNLTVSIEIDGKNYDVSAELLSDNNYLITDVKTNDSKQLANNDNMMYNNYQDEKQYTNMELSDVKEGELKNDFYNSLTKKQWYNYHQKMNKVMNSTYGNLTRTDVIGGKLVITEIVNHKEQVTNVLKVRNDNKIASFIKENINGYGYDRATIENIINEVYGEENVRRYDSTSGKFIPYGNNGESIESINTNSTKSDGKSIERRNSTNIKTDVQEELNDSSFSIEEKTNQKQSTIDDKINQLNEKLDKVIENIGIDKYTEEDMNQLENTTDKVDTAFTESQDNIDVLNKPDILRDIRNKAKIDNNEARALYDKISKADNVTQIENALKGYKGIVENMSNNEITNFANDLYQNVKTTEDFRAARYNDSMYKYENRESLFENAPEQNEDIIEMQKNYPNVKEVLDLYLQNQYDKINNENNSKNTQEKIKVEKSKYRQFKDTTQYLFVNRNVAFDNLANEYNNPQIKYKADMLNGAVGEVSGDVYTAQTDNEGHAMGKSLISLFAESKKNGTYDAFNDYLEQYSNIDRHKQGKGSTTPLVVSESLVKQYEALHPEFKTMAKDVWQYGDNALKNMVASGLQTQQRYDALREMYPHYVPFMENREMTNFRPDIKEAKPLQVVKKAEGGAKNILAIEEALTKYTSASKISTRQNQLMQEIVNTLGQNPIQNDTEIITKNNIQFDPFEAFGRENGTGIVSEESANNFIEMGGDARSDPTNLETSLYADDTGYYATAYFEGEPKTVAISEEIYHALKKDMEQNIRNLEQKLSFITDPLQKVSNVRRNVLTTWSPTFLLTNPIKDIQDAVVNSKYTTSMLKNYPTSFYELSGGGQNATAKQFLTLYGGANLMGNYEAESGLSNGTVIQKAANSMKGLSKLNEIIELAPRYAEFKASLEHGTTLQEAMYNAREVTINFNRGGVITKALNRNGATFLNASVQGFDKLIRNFSGQNGAKGVVSSLAKVAVAGIAPAVFNHIVFDSDDGEKDKDYEALPDYIKDNYYLIKMPNGEFMRIPKGRMLGIFGSAARRTLEYADGEKNAFEGYLDNAWSQVGFNNPEENNIFAPFMQAFGSENGEAWYGGDLVPKRLQDKAPREQYDASTDEFSKWLGDKLNISPYKINYVLDQYSGGIGDMLLPLITEEANTGSDNPIDIALAPLRDKFVVDSTNDNKYAGEIYDLTDKRSKATTKEKATDEYKIQSSYLGSITSEMGKLYAERREVQSDKTLSKKEKYERVQKIQDEINSLAKEGMNNYQNIEKTDNYAVVGDVEVRKYTSNGETKWKKVKEDELEDLNSLGMDINEKSSYFKAKEKISEIKESYKGTKNTAAQKREIINTIKNSGLTSDQKSYLYDKYYSNKEMLDIVNKIGLNFDSFLDYEAQDFESDKDKYGKTISGSKRKKVFNYINNMNATYEQKLILAKLQYNSYNDHNKEIISYLNNNNNISYNEMVTMLKKMGFKVDSNGTIKW